MSWSASIRARAVLVVLVVLVLAVPLGACRRRLTAPGALPFAALESTVTADSAAHNASATLATINPVERGSSAPSAGGSTSGGTSVTGGSGSSSTASKAGKSTPKPAAGMLLLVQWWDDTASKPATGWEIVYGKTVVKPRGKKGSASVGPVPYGGAAEILVYPDGLNGKRIAVPITVTADMLANSQQDAVHVSVTDKGVRVLGNPVHNVDRTYERF